MPQGLDMSDFEGASLPRNETGLPLMTFGLTVSMQPVLFHEAANRRVAGQIPELGLVAA